MISTERKRYECSKCGFTDKDRDYVKNQCCPMFDCDECGCEYYSQEEADACCESCVDCGCYSGDCCGCGSCSGCGCDCDSCGCTNAHTVDVVGSDFSEQDITQRFGIKRERDLAQLCADYYLLLNMWQIEKSKQAEKLITEMANELAPEFATYLDLAIGGEIRYAAVESYPSLDVSPGRKVRGTRGLAWETWAEWKPLPERTEYAIQVFDMGDLWPSDGYGGPAWKSIAEGLKLRIDGMDDRLWLDRIWNLQHNGGCCLNKVYNVTNSFQQVLEAHGQDNIDVLLDHASEQIRKLWESKEYIWHHEAHELWDRTYSQAAAFESYFQKQKGRWRGQMRWQAVFTSE